MRRWLAIVCLLACNSSPARVPERPVEVAELEVTDPEVAEREEPPEPQVHLPDDAATFPPSLVRAPEVTDAEIERMRNVELCATCHPTAAATWRESAHAHASFDNPFYRATVEEFRRARGERASRFCAGCHDPLLLLSGAIDAPIADDDARAVAGVTCMVCHGITDARADGNGSYDLRVDDPLFPDPANAASVEEHRTRMVSSALRETKMCGSCHRSFAGEAIGNSHHFAGIDDLGAWGQSAYAGSHANMLEPRVTERDCRVCHMPSVDAREDMGRNPSGEMASHRFAGAHFGLSDDPEQHRAVEEQLVGAASIDVAALKVGARWSYPAELAETARGEIAIDVVVRNQHVGHRFPGGTRDIQDTWIELTLLDGDGRVIASAGDRHAEREDPTTFRLRAVVMDDQGAPEEQHLVHRFVASAFDRTLAPREAMTVRYRVELPPRARVSTIEARLRHRRHGRSLRALACRTRGLPTREGRRIDGCAEPPITEIARAQISLANHDAEGDASRPRWERLCDLGAGLLRGVQERLDEARAPLEHALELTDVPAQRAQVWSLLGRVAARQGRLDEALEHFQHAEEVAPGHPAIARGRGIAFSQVWRFEDAAREYRAVLERSPRDSRAYRDLARALGSAERDNEARVISRDGLRLAPRAGDLLRSQALSLDAEHPMRARAQEAFLDHRRHDQAPTLLQRCQDEHQECERDRRPVPEVQMRLR